MCSSYVASSLCSKKREPSLHSHSTTSKSIMYIDPKYADRNSLRLLPTRLSPKRTILLYTLLLALVIWSRAPGCDAQTVHSLTDPMLDSFDCAALNESAKTGVAGDPDALETLRAWCASDTHCAQLYGQDGSVDLNVFVHLFQTSLTQPVVSVSLEDPVFDMLCNKTAEEFLRLAWNMILINQLLSASPCDVNERPRLRDDSSGVDCVCQPGKICDSPSAPLVIGIILVVIVGIAAVAQCWMEIWTRYRLLTATRYRKVQVAGAGTTARSRFVPSEAGGSVIGAGEPGFLRHRPVPSVYPHQHPYGKMGY